MREIVIISGKGGTGKTSLTAAFAALAARDAAAAGKALPVLADCDVDAADLHLVLAPETKRRVDFYAGREAVVDAARCSGCGLCAEVCRFGAVAVRSDGGYEVSGCEGCGACVDACQAKAIDFPDRRCGQWFDSSTRFGPFVHARLEPGAENSGKLVTLVRREARARAEETGAALVLVDGTPGIGCPVIASVTGADAAVAVVEPSVSGAHDLERVAALARHFRVPLSVVVNKRDINPDVAAGIEAFCSKSGVAVLGSVPYDLSITAAQVAGKSIVEFDGRSAASAAIESIWKRLSEETCVQ